MIGYTCHLTLCLAVTSSSAELNSINTDTGTKPNVIVPSPWMLKSEQLEVATFF